MATHFLTERRVRGLLELIADGTAVVVTYKNITDPHTVAPRTAQGALLRTASTWTVIQSSKPPLTLPSTQTDVISINIIPASSPATSPCGASQNADTVRSAFRDPSASPAVERRVRTPTAAATQRPQTTHSLPTNDSAATGDQRSKRHHTPPLRSSQPSPRQPAPTSKVVSMQRMMLEFMECQQQQHQSYMQQQQAHMDRMFSILEGLLSPPAPAAPPARFASGANFAMTFGTPSWCLAPSVSPIHTSSGNGYTCADTGGSMSTQGHNTLAALLRHPDRNVRLDALSTLASHADGPVEAVQVATSLLPDIVHLLAPANRADEGLLLTALRAIVKVSLKMDSRNCAFTSDVLGGVLAFVTHPNAVIRKEVCQLLSLFSMGTFERVQAAIDAGLIPPLIYVIHYEVDDSVAEEAIWAIANLTTFGKPEQMAHIATTEGFSALLHRLKSVTDPRLQEALLEALVCCLGADGTSVAKFLEIEGSVDQLRQMGNVAGLEEDDEIAELIQMIRIRIGDYAFDDSEIFDEDY